MSTWQPVTDCKGRLRFKPIEHAGVLPCIKTLQRQQPRQRYRLTRTLTRPGGLQAGPVAEGAQHAALLQQVQAMQAAQQLRSAPPTPSSTARWPTCPGCNCRPAH